MRGLNWGDERYVRLFTRDTSRWKKLSWHARGLYALLRRTADRAGVIDDLDDRVAVAALVDAREDKDGISAALDELVDNGWIEEHHVAGGLRLVIPEFIESEEAQALPAARQRALRERRRDKGRLREQASETETSPLDVTPASHASVTLEGHAGGVTLGASRLPVTPASPLAVPAVPPVPAVLPREVAPTRVVERVEPRHDDGGESDPVEAIRLKLLRMPPPIQHLEARRAHERFASNCIGGQATLADAFAGIDAAALKLGERLGAIGPDDTKGLAELEKFVAGCIGKQPLIRKSQGGRAPGRPEDVTPIPPAIAQELVTFLCDRFAHHYERARWNYGRYVRASEDETHALAIARYALREAGGSEPRVREIIEHVVERFLLDDYYQRQGHALRYLALIVEREPARYGLPRAASPSSGASFEPKITGEGDGYQAKLAGVGRPPIAARRPSEGELDEDTRAKRAQG